MSDTESQESETQRSRSESSGSSDEVPAKRRCSRCGSRRSRSSRRNRSQHSKKRKTRVVQESSNDKKKSVTLREDIKKDTIKSPPATKDKDCQKGERCPTLSPLFIDSNEKAFRIGDHRAKFEITLEMIMEAMKQNTKMHSAVSTGRLAGYIAVDNLRQCEEELTNKLRKSQCFVKMNIKNILNDHYQIPEFMAELEHKLETAAEIGAIVKMKQGTWLMTEDQLSVPEYQTHVSQFRRIYIDQELQPPPRPRTFTRKQYGEVDPAVAICKGGNPYADEEIV